MVFFHMPIIIFLPHPKKWLLLFGTKTGQQYAPAYSGRRDCRPESRLKSRSGSRSESKLKSRPGTDRGQTGEQTGRTERTGIGAGSHTGSGSHKII